MKSLLIVLLLFVMSFSEYKELTIKRWYRQTYTIGYIKELDLCILEPPHYMFSGDTYFSCIGEGKYRLIFQRMETFGDKDVRLLLLDYTSKSADSIVGTDGRQRSAIFIHEGDNLNMTIGCMLVGNKGDFIQDSKTKAVRMYSRPMSDLALKKLEQFYSADKYGEEGKRIVGIIKIEEDSTWAQDGMWLLSNKLRYGNRAK